MAKSIVSKLKTTALLLLGTLIINNTAMAKDNPETNDPEVSETEVQEVLQGFSYEEAEESIKDIYKFAKTDMLVLTKIENEDIGMVATFNQVSKKCALSDPENCPEKASIKVLYKNGEYSPFSMKQTNN